MSCHFLTSCKLVAGGLGLLCFLGHGTAATAQPSTAGVANQRHYTLTARVRPLLFWISRPGVGGARIAWKEDAQDRKQIELLIGSDPERAPMRINRWGYISESLSGSSLELLGVMTESEEESVDQARARISDSGARHPFKAIRGTVNERYAEARVTHMLLNEDYTYRDLDRLLLQLPQTGRVTPAVPLPVGVKPGFLIAVQSVVHRNAERFRGSGKTQEREEDCLFVYNGAVYKLTARSSNSRSQVTVNGRSYRDVIETRFETRKVTTGSTSAFTVWYGTEDPVREVPIRIVYRPRWWFEAELQLADAPVMALASTERP